MVLEAMASGLAVVAYDYAAAGELLEHGLNGMVAPLADRRRFVDCAVELSERAALWRRVGAAARATAERTGWSRVVEEFEARLEGPVAADRLGRAVTSHFL